MLRKSLLGLLITISGLNAGVFSCNVGCNTSSCNTTSGTCVSTNTNNSISININQNDLDKLILQLTIIKIQNSNGIRPGEYHTNCSLCNTASTTTVVIK